MISIVSSCHMFMITINFNNNGLTNPVLLPPPLNLTVATRLRFSQKLFPLGVLSCKQVESHVMREQRNFPFYTIAIFSSDQQLTPLLCFKVESATKVYLNIEASLATIVGSAV